MTDRDNPVTVYLTDAEKADLTRWADKTGKSVSELSRDAIREYTDRGRFERIEAKLDSVLDSLDADTHTHKQRSGMNTQGSPATERARDMVTRLRSNHDAVVKDDAVVRTIEDIAGADNRTIKKYKRLFRKRGLLFEHPAEPPLWTFETSQWLEWMQDYANLNGTDKTEEVVDAYPAQVVVTSDGYRIEAHQDQIEAND